MTPTRDELAHLRGALGRMYRGQSGQIVINPAPESSGHRFAMQRNASRKIVAKLIDKGWLAAENSNGEFLVTPAGQSVLDEIADSYRRPAAEARA